MYRIRSYISSINRGLIYILLVGFAGIVVGPLIIIVSSAFKTNAEIAENALALPTYFRWENIVNAWETAKFGMYAKNSFIIAAGTTLVIVFVSVLAGYALSILRLPGGKGLSIFFLLGMAIPLHGIVVSQYMLLLHLGLLNTRLGVIFVIAGMHMSFGIYMMRGFFKGISHEIVDAAKVDGCSDFQILLHIVGPMSKPAVWSLVVFIFTWSWNELLVPLIFITDDSLRTISVGLTFYQGRFTTDYSLTAAGALIAAIPSLIIYILFQRELIHGISAGSLAGQ